jgi:hypothetical protein
MHLPGLSSLTRKPALPGPRDTAAAASAPAASRADKAARGPALATPRGTAGASAPEGIDAARGFGEGSATATALVARPSTLTESGLNLANPSVVNHHNSLQLMKVCKDAYTDFNYSVGHTQFLHREYADHQIISYSGSKEWQDWAHDANIVKTPYKDMGWVHKGFSSAYDELLPIQDKVLNKDKPVVVTGHSLGGATATIAAVDLKARGYKVHSLTTFGCPKVGGDSFHAAFDKADIPAFRYVNAWDVVPRVPKGDFEHVGQPFYLSTRGEMLPRQQSGWELAMKPWQLAQRRIDSHHMPNYIGNLQKYLS